MIRKVLIANRGEIAVRIIRTCRRLGIATVAVHSNPDRDALFVEMADEAVSLGGNTASESYLQGARIIEAALRCGADAIHPGYGFLSENPDFAEAVESAGLRFIGPPASAIRAMGFKDAAKAAMEKAGVPVVPGYHGEERDPDRLLEEARRIGFPVLIKARAGGGGKGMRRVDREDEFMPALQSAEREAAASFGDPACLIEKYVSHPRHIEIQVFADNHGNVVHLFERDCSLQRRHQKVIEEAPAPGMSAEMREAMGAAAIRAAKAIGYSGAGTIEFIADASEGLRMDRFWFMEMNTRLQVEHPVTEAITGVDLVEWQLRVASGEKLPLQQHELSINGWAMEARLYAENPERNFLPSTGRIGYLAVPETNVRVDSGIRSGDVVTPFYDPMIAKIIVHATDRDLARTRLAAALEETCVLGLETNSRFLARLARQADFAAGLPDTGLIARSLETIVNDEQPDLLDAAVAALVLSGLDKQPAGSDPWDLLSGFRVFDTAEEIVVLEGGGGPLTLHLVREAGSEWLVRREDQTIRIHIAESADGQMRLSADGRTRRVTVHRHGAVVAVNVGSGNQRFRLHDPVPADSAGAGGNVLRAPMPGLIRQLPLAVGTLVRMGEPVAVMEAMKMELTLSAPMDGRIAALGVTAGQQVGEGALIAEFQPLDEG